jgi:hypothetical protein
MNKLNLKFILLLLLGTSSITTLQAQLSISPPYISVDGRSGVGNLYINNNSATPQEVEISFAFGYPASDTAGNLVMNYKDSVAYKKYGLDSVIRAFPRTFILPGNQQRTIRIRVKPTPGMKDGFYFTRVKVLTKPQTPDVAKTTTEGVTTRINFNFEQVIPAFYKRGKVTTGLKVEKIDAIQKDTNLVILAHLVRLGEAPFIGRIMVKLIDAKGKVVATTRSSMTAYFTELRRVDMAIAKVTPGPYRMEVTFETKRADMAIGDLVQAQPLKEISSITIK